MILEASVITSHWDKEPYHDRLCSIRIGNDLELHITWHKWDDEDKGPYIEVKTYRITDNALDALSLATFTDQDHLTWFDNIWKEMTK